MTEPRRMIGRKMYPRDNAFAPRKRPKRFSKENLGIGAFIALWLFVLFINLAWMGLLAWAIVRVVLHFT